VLLRYHPGVPGAEEQRVGRYRLVQLIATGGMGEVFLARREGPDGGRPERVVIKRILRHLAADAAFVRMFLNEARIAALLAHPKVVQIYELDSENGTCFMAMEYVHGASLRAIQAKAIQSKQRVPAAIVAGVCAQALEGLHYAHLYKNEKEGISGVVHRDVSPDNVLVGFDGGVKVGDFGIAKALKDDDATRTGLLKGKIAYMSPEHLEGHPVDARADVYGMGIVLYELLTGVRPFAAATDALLIHTVLSGVKPRPPHELQPEVAPQLEAAALRALSRDPADRFATAREMADALGAAATPIEIAVYLSQLFGAEAQTDPELGRAPVAGTVALREGEPATDLRLAPPRRRAIRLGLPAAVAAALLAMGIWLGTRAPAAMPPPASAPPPLASAPASPPADATEAPTAAEPSEPAPAPREHARRTPKPGKVVFRVYPWAEVFYRGKSLGVTPIAPVETPPGVQTFVLRNAELAQEKEVRIQVSPGAVSTYKLDFLKR
jgi:hypothetical protein